MTKIDALFARYAELVFEIKAKQAEMELVKSQILDSRPTIVDAPDPERSLRGKLIEELHRLPRQSVAELAVAARVSYTRCREELTALRGQGKINVDQTHMPHHWFLAEEGNGNAEIA